MNRRAFTLAEIGVLLPAALVILGVVLFALSRMTFQGAWNAGRLGATDAALIHLEKARMAMIGAESPVEAASAVKRPAAVADATVGWRDAGAGIVEIALTAQEGKAAPVRVSARVHLTDTGARSAFGSWSDE